MVFACALAATSHDALKQPASRILQFFTRGEFSVNFVTRQAGKRSPQNSAAAWPCAGFARFHSFDLTAKMRDLVEVSQVKSGVAGELEAGQRRDRISTLLQCENLETSS